LGVGSCGGSNIDEAHLCGLFRREADVADLFGKEHNNSMDSQGKGEGGEEGRMFHGVSGDDSEGLEGYISERPFCGQVAKSEVLSP
jgi:hypothetical protein